MAEGAIPTSYLLDLTQDHAHRLDRLADVQPSGDSIDRPDLDGRLLSLPQDGQSSFCRPSGQPISCRARRIPES